MTRGERLREWSHAMTLLEPAEWSAFMAAALETAPRSRLLLMFENMAAEDRHRLRAVLRMLP